MSLSENTLIDWLQERYNQDQAISGIGDDCAVFSESSQSSVHSIDTLCEGVHFTSEDNAEAIGHKAAAVTLSDIAAMGAKPAAIFISLALPENRDFQWIKSFFLGLEGICNTHRVIIAGGDTVRSPHLVITTSGIGYLQGAPFMRSTALPGDDIYVTGSFGFSFPDKHLSFLPRVNESLWLRDNVEVTSMTDASDGLYQSLNLLSLQQNKGALIDLSAIPVNSPPQESANHIKGALYDGEDFELVFTVKKMISTKLLSKFSGIFSLPLTKIGCITEEKQLIFEQNKKKVTIDGKPFQHFE